MQVLLNKAKAAAKQKSKPRELNTIKRTLFKEELPNIHKGIVLLPYYHY
jgi:hypothetical protein